MASAQQIVNKMIEAEFSSESDAFRSRNIREQRMKLQSAIDPRRVYGTPNLDKEWDPRWKDADQERRDHIADVLRETEKFCDMWGIEI